MESRLKQLLKTIKLNESMISMLFGVVTVILVGVLVLRMYNAKKATITAEADKTEIMTEKDQATTAESVTVKVGDNLWKIAEIRYGSGYNWVDIAKENKLKNANQIEVGMKLALPKVEARILTKAKVAEKPQAITISGDSYTVVKGDNLWSICVRAYGDGYKWSEVAKANQLANPGRILVGQVIKLPR